MLNFLQRVRAHKIQELQTQMQRLPLAELRARLRDLSPPRDFVAALQGPGVALIAEVKAASPSAGVLHAQLDPAAQARAYARGGAAALSVLTDQAFFHGALTHLTAARAATGLPVLRKDFILSAYQVYEARAAGADAVLLIVALLEPPVLRDLIALAADLGLAALVEVHTPAEAEQALKAGARLIGVNNRNLHTLQVDLGTAEALLPQLPPPVGKVAESGIATPADVQRMAAAGADAVLVGTALVRAADPTALARALVRAGQPYGQGVTP